MEQFEPRPLPDIFKFSHISLVLAYYGWLHKWKVLMESLSKDTIKMWKDNLNAFINWGESLKAHIIIEYNPEKSEKLISKLEFNFKFVNCFYLHSLWIKLFISRINKGWFNDNIIFISPYDYFLDGILKEEEAYKHLEPWNCRFYKIFICTEEQASKKISAIKCPNFKDKPDYLFDEKILNSLIGKSLYSIFVFKYQGVFKYKKLYNKIYELNQNHRLKKFENMCTI